MKSLRHSYVLGFSTGALLLVGTLAWGLPPSAIGAAPILLVQEPQSPQTLTPQQEQPQQAAAQAKTFTGTIVKDGDGYALRTSTGDEYKLDDSTQAKQYEGKSVTVVGQLDTSAQMIKVSSIEGASQ